MKTDESADALRAKLHSRMPLLGSKWRLQALAELENRMEEPALLDILVASLDHFDPEIRSRISTILGATKSARVRDQLCALAQAKPDSPVGRLCLAAGHRPSDPERDVVYLLLTGQADRFFSDNEYGRDEFVTLRAAYDKAEPAVKSRIMELVRSGDRRWQPFVTRPRKELPECTDQEIRFALQSCLRHRDWPRLFQAVLELPMKYSFPLLEKLRRSGWEPEAPDLRSLYRQLLADSAGASAPTAGSSAPAQPPQAGSQVFERWLAAGRQPELTRLGEAELVQRLAKADPPDGVPLVSALATKSPLQEATIRAIAENEHWLIRLAGLVTGLTKDIVAAGPPDPVYWVNELSGAAGVLEFWPGKATPRDLEKLNNAPAEAYQGKLGAVRKVLRGIVAYRVDAAEFDKLIVLAGDTDAEFVTE